MRRQKSSPLRGSVTQNTMSVRMRAREQSGIGFLARLGLLATSAFIILGIVFWLWRTGWISRQIERVENVGLTLTQNMHFYVTDIIVKGRQQESKDSVFDALGTQQGAPILGFDSAAATARLVKLPWIESATVERRLPDTIVVLLTERVPAALWQHDDHIVVIDADGQVLPAAKAEDFPKLPLVVGFGADKEAQNFLTLLKAYPDIQSKTDSAVRVGDRRWDLHMLSKIVVRLPEQDVETALHRLSVLMAQEKVLDRDIVAIDLRIPDRLIIEPAPGSKQTGVTQ
jgi:cell division protein FtsQ